MSDPVTFGQFVKSIRKRNRIGLREFLLATGFEGQYWSRLERGVVGPPEDSATLFHMATKLGLVPFADDFLTFIRLAADYLPPEPVSLVDRLPLVPHVRGERLRDVVYFFQGVDMSKGESWSATVKIPAPQKPTPENG